MGGLIKFLGRFRSASNRALALMASLLISVSELAALHVIYMYHGTGTCTISCTCMYFMLLPPVRLHVVATCYLWYVYLRYRYHHVFSTSLSGTIIS